MSKYAANTDVSTDKSKSEIERTLERYGAESFAYSVMPGMAVVVFEMEGKRVMLRLPLPDRNAEEFTLTPSRGFQRTEQQARTAWEQACRQRWRALALVIKAKLEAVEAGITDFQEEFMANLVLPDRSGATVGDWLKPQIEESYRTGKLPELMPGIKCLPNRPLLEVIDVEG